MKVLLYQKENMHTEVMGFFLHQYRNEEIHICHRYVDSPFNWVPLFEQAIGISCQYITRPDFTQYDKIIFITSRNLEELVAKGRLHGVDPSRVLQIRHTNQDKWAPGYPNISLTPLVQAENGNLLTVFPGLQRSPADLPPTSTWVLTVVGLSDYSAPKKDIQDLQLLVQTLDYARIEYCIQIITRKGTRAEQELGHYRRIKFLYDLTCEEVDATLKKSHFILPLPKKGGAYYKNLMTGILPLALSYEIPLLAPSLFYEIYGLQHQPAVWHSLSEYTYILKGEDDKWYQEVVSKAAKDAQVQREWASRCLLGISCETI